MSEAALKMDRAVNDAGRTGYFQNFDFVFMKVSQPVSASAHTVYDSQRRLKTYM